jgi:hypothetical protein
MELMTVQTSGITSGLVVIGKTRTPSEYPIYPVSPSRRADPTRSKIKSQTRCKIRKDAGLTRANTTGMKYFCLFFARGCCPYGWECEYLHALPDASCVLPDNSKDCFARDKFADYRDDMGGVGSFQRINRTLYIGRVKELGSGPETEEMVTRHFREWGDIEHSEFPCPWSCSSPLFHFFFPFFGGPYCCSPSPCRAVPGITGASCVLELLPILPFFSSCIRRTHAPAVRVLQYRSVAFVTYALEVSAQFAKEAMACQSLDGDEILNVRWATEDPNPTSKAAETVRLQEAGQAAIAARMDPRIVDAMRAVRALEDGEPLEDGHLLEGAPDVDADLDDGGAPPAKRRRMEPATPLAEVEADVEEVRAALGVPPAPTSLLSADALEGLQYFAQIRAQRDAARPPPAPAPKPLTGGMGVGDYGSDDED